MMRVVVFALVALHAGALTMGAESRAEAWLKARNGEPDLGDLNDYAKTDPNGYALVKALMLKRSLGLLDPRKPTASFAAPATHESLDDHEVGAAAFNKFASPGELNRHAHHAAMVSEESFPVEQMSEPIHHMNTQGFAWKASNDDDMVASVLGQAPQPMGGSVQSSLLSQSRETGTVSVSHLTADEMLMGTATSEADASGIPTFHIPSAAAAAPEQPVVARPSLPQAQSSSPLDAAASFVPPELHLVSVEGVPSEHAPVAKEQPQGKPAASSSGNPYLSGIDFGATPKQEVVEPIVHASKIAAPVSSSSDNPYLSGIDFANKPSTAVKAHAAMAAESTPLDFNKEIAKISAPVQKPKVSFSSQSRKVTTGSNYLDSIGFSDNLFGGSTAVNEDVQRYETPFSQAAQTTHSRLRKSTSMIKETTVAVTDFAAPNTAVLGKWLGQGQSDDEADDDSEAPLAPKKTQAVVNPYMTDLD